MWCTTTPLSNFHSPLIRSVRLPKFETPMTIYDKQLSSIIKLISTIKDLLSKSKKSNSYMNKLSQLLNNATKIRDHSTNCQHSMSVRLSNQSKSKSKNTEKIEIETLQDISTNPILKSYDTNENWKSYYTIENFNFYGRGLFLTFIHAIEGCVRKLRANPTETRLEKQMQKMKIIADILEVGEFAMSQLEGQIGLSPWNEGIDIDKYDVMQLDPKVFIDELGSQYVPTLSKFFSLLIANTASHQSSGGSLHAQLYYMLSNGEASHQTVQFFKTVTHSKGKKLWDFEVHSSVIKTGYYMMLSRVNTSITFSVTREQLDMQLDLGDLEKSSFELTETQPKDDVYIEEIKDTKKTSLKKEIDGNISMSDFQIYYNQLNSHLGDWKSPSVEGRLISPYHIENNLGIKTSVDFPTFKFFENVWAKIIPTNTFDKAKEGCVLFHIHGGGFVAMSTYTHEAYLRRWANKIAKKCLSKVLG
jgi:hypothetical protein